MPIALTRIGVQKTDIRGNSAMRGLVVITGLFLVAGCSVTQTAKISCPPPAGHVITKEVTVDYISGGEAAREAAYQQAVEEALNSCERHQSREPAPQAASTISEQSSLKSNKKTGLGGAVGVGVITAGLALIGGTSSSSDTQ